MQGSISESDKLVIGNIDIQKFVDGEYDLNSLLSERTPQQRFELLLELLCRLPLHYYGIDEKTPSNKLISPQRDSTIGSRSRANSILKSSAAVASEQPPTFEKNIANLWHRFGSLAHLRQAGFHRANSNEFFMHTEVQLADTGSKSPKEDTLPHSIILTPAKQAHPLIAKLVERLLGIEYPVKILHGLIHFMRDLYTKNIRPIKSYNEFIATKLTENIEKQSDENFYWLLAALHCAPFEAFGKTCKKHITHFAAKLALMFIALDNQQTGLSSKVIAATADQSSCLADTLYKEFNLSEEFANAESREIAVRLKIVYFANDKINSDLLAELKTASDDEIYHQIDGINILSLFIQHANQFMIAMSQFGDQSLYRGHVIILTRDLFKQLGDRRLTALIKQKTLHGTHIFHQLAILTKIDFLLATFAEYLAKEVLQAAICQPDVNNATSFHYACYYRNIAFLEFIKSHAEQHKYLPALQAAGAITNIDGNNVLHLCSMLRNNDIEIANDVMKQVIATYGPAAENLASIRNHSGLTPLAQCCLTFEEKLITTMATAFHSGEAKLRAVKDLVNPDKPEMQTAPLQAMCTFTESIAPLVDCIEVLSALLCANTPQEIQIFAKKYQTTDNDQKLTEFKKSMVKHFIGIDCNDVLFQNLCEIMAKAQASSSEITQIKSKLLTYIQTGLASLKSLSAKTNAVLILAAHTITDSSPFVAQQIVFYCRKNAEYFAQALLNLTQTFTRDKLVKAVGKTFSHPTLLRTMICSTFPILDESITAILAQWEVNDTNTIAQLKNMRNQNLLQALLHRLASSDHKPEEIATITQRFCEFIGNDLIAQLATDEAKESIPLMVMLAKHPKLHCLISSAETWTGPVNLKEQLNNAEVMKSACKSLNTVMLCFLKNHLEANVIAQSYPFAKNIFHALLLYLADLKNYDKERLRTFLVFLIKQLDIKNTLLMVRENLSDGRNPLDIIAAQPKLNFILATLEEVVKQDTTIAQNSISAACKYHNAPMLHWCVKIVENAEPYFDQNTPLQTICANDDIAKFEKLCKSIGKNNVKSLIASMPENILHLVCQPHHATGKSIQDFINSKWDQNNPQKLSRQDHNHFQNQQALFTAITALFDNEELNNKALLCDANNNNALILACCTGDTTLIQQCLKLYSTSEAQRKACKQTDKTTGVSALHIAAAVCSTEVLKTFLTVLDQNARAVCLQRLHNFGRLNLLDCAYLSDNTPQRTGVLQLLCQTLSTQLIDAIIRPLSANIPSLIESSVSQDKIIINHLLTLDLSQQTIVLLTEIARGDSYRIDAMASLIPIRGPYNAKSPRSSIMDTPTQRARSQTQEGNRRRGSTLNEGQLPLPAGRAGKLSPRKLTSLGPSSGAVMAKALHLDTATQQESHPPILGETHEVLLHKLLEIKYSTTVLQNICSFIYEAYTQSDINDEALISILTNALATRIFKNNDTTTLETCLILASIILIDTTNSHSAEAFIEKCRKNLLELAEAIPCLLQKLNAGESAIKDTFISRLLTQPSLLRKTIIACFEISEQQMQNQKYFLESLQTNSVKPLEQKLEIYLTAVAQHEQDQIISVNDDGMDILQSACREIATYEITPQRSTAISQFMSTLLRNLQKKQALDYLLLRTDDNQENILHYVAERKSLGFLIKTFREVLSQNLFSQLLVATDKHHRTPLHIACATQQIQVLEEMLTGASAEALTALSQIVTNSDGYNLLHLACLSHRNQRALEIQALCEGRKSIPAKSLPRLYLANLDLGIAVQMVALLIKFFPKHIAQMSLQPDCAGNTPFLLCCYTNSHKLLSMLSKTYTDTNERRLATNTTLAPFNITPLHVVCAFCDHECIDIVLEGLGTNLGKSYLVKSPLLGTPIESCEFTATEPAQIKEIKKILALELAENLDLIIDFSIDYLQLVSLIRAGITTENIEKLCNRRGENMLFIFLRKLALSGYAQDTIQAEYTKFTLTLDESLTQLFSNQTIKQSGETIMHLLASEKTLAPLLSILSTQDHKALSIAFACNKSQETPLHIACRTQNLEFVRFSKLLSMSSPLIKKGAVLLTKPHHYTVFHLIIASCFTQDILRVKAIMEGKEAPPAQGFSREQFRNILTDDKIQLLFTELFEICGDSTKSLLARLDQDGNTALMLLCYLNDPRLLNTFMIATEFDFKFLSEVANISLPKTQITPLQLLSAIGSAPALTKFIYMLGETARVACLQTNKQIGGRNALACCYYLTNINDQNDEERLALQQVFTELMAIIPDELEKALLCELANDVLPTLILSIMRDQCLAREGILANPKFQSAFPVELLVDILFEPYVLPAPTTAMRTSNRSAFFSASNNNNSATAPSKNIDISPLININELRHKLVKCICLFSFIPDDLLQTMVALVTKARKLANSSDRKFILLSLFNQMVQQLALNDQLNNFAVIFLASTYPISHTFTREEVEFCNHLSKNPDILANILRDFVSYLNQSTLSEDLGNEFLRKLYHEESLFKAAMLKAFKEKFSKSDFKNENTFIAKIMQIAQATKTKTINLSAFSDSFK